MRPRSKSHQQEPQFINYTSTSKNPKSNVHKKTNIYQGSLYKTDQTLHNASQLKNNTPRNTSNPNMIDIRLSDEKDFKPYNHKIIYNSSTAYPISSNANVNSETIQPNQNISGKAMKYLNIAQFRKKNILNIYEEDQLDDYAGYVGSDNKNQVDLSLSEINKISPYACLCFNVGRAFQTNNNENNQKQHKNANQKSTKDENKKQVIKQKIKDRVKAQIQNLIKRNTFKLKKIDNNNINIHHTNANTYTYKFLQPSPKQGLPSQNVSVIGSSVQKPFDNMSSERQKLVASSYDSQYQQNKLKNIRKSILLGELGFKSRKVQSSLENRLTTKQRQKEKEQWINRMQDSGTKMEDSQKQRQKLFTPVQSYRRTMSTDIRIKSMSRRKASQLQLRSLKMKNKQEGLQPWIVSSFADQQVNF